MHFDITSQGAVWSILTLVNANIAQCKNRSGLNWFLLSIILGPSATLILAFMDKLPNMKSAD